MRYNIVKIKLGFGFLEYEAKNVSESEAINKLNDIHEREMCRMFQDVMPIQELQGMQYFHVINNDICYQYQVEESMSWKLEQIAKPKISTFSNVEVNDVSKNFQLN